MAVASHWFDLQYGADARDFHLPRDGRSAYFNDAFDAVFLASVATRQVETFEREGASLVVVYVNPQHGERFERSAGMIRLMRNSAVAVYQDFCLSG